VTAASPGPGLGTTMTLRLPLANPMTAPDGGRDLGAQDDARNRVAADGLVDGLVKGTASAVPSDRL
jgi:hypothetical protein